MKIHFPDTDTLRTVLTLATRAPSIHNSQPWRWRIGDGTLQLYVDGGLQLPAVDPDGRDLILSCGAALDHCVSALAALGWRSVVHRLPDPADADLLATIEVCPGDRPHDADVTLAAAITRRRTDRRRFSARHVSDSDIALMGARAARLGVMLRRFDELDALAAIVTRAVAHHAADRDYLAELTAWSGRYGSVAGVPARNIPATDATAPLAGRIFAGARLAQPPGVDQDNAVLLALGTVADDRLAWLRAGEASSTVLLTATALGMSSCPVTEPLEIEETRAAVRDDVFGTSGHPQMLLRIGWAPIDAEALPPTPRRAIDDVVQWLGSAQRG